MKLAFVACICFFSLISYSAQNNPQIRECNLQNGQFVVAQTEHDQVGICKLGGAIIGALDLFIHNSKQGIPDSLNMYLNGNFSCDPFGSTTTITTLSHLNLQVCFFDDGSFIGLKTLSEGIHSPFNRKLNKALGL